MVMRGKGHGRRTISTPKRALDRFAMYLFDALVSVLQPAFHKSHHIFVRVDPRHFHINAE
jgi:hypothetical protein